MTTLASVKLSSRFRAVKHSEACWRSKVKNRGESIGRDHGAAEDQLATDQFNTVGKSVGGRGKLVWDTMHRGGTRTPLRTIAMSSKRPQSSQRMQPSAILDLASIFFLRFSPCNARLDGASQPVHERPITALTLFRASALFALTKAPDPLDAGSPWRPSRAR